MKKPKSKLERAEREFADYWGQPVVFYYDEEAVKLFRRQLNNLIRLAKAEALENTVYGIPIKKLKQEEREGK